MVWLLVATRNPGCLAQEEGVNNRYIIEFQDSDQGSHAKQRLLKSSDADDIQVISHISRRNIAVVKFSSREAAEQWENNQKENIRRMEKGEYKSTIWYFYYCFLDLNFLAFLLYFLFVSPPP